MQIYNGVDAERFAPGGPDRRERLPAGFAPPGTVVVGTVGRMQTVKNPLGLVDAFVHLLASVPDARRVLRLVMLGDGALMNEVRHRLDDEGASEVAWLPGARDDVPDLLKAFDVFALPSLNEGISNTILEAMATGLPVVATDVGGNPELVVDGETGALVAADDPEALAGAIGRYTADAALREAHGAAARRRIETSFSLEAMVTTYLSLYERLLSAKTAAGAARVP